MFRSFLFISYKVLVLSKIVISTYSYAYDFVILCWGSGTISETLLASFPRFSSPLILNRIIKLLRMGVFQICASFARF